MKYINEFKNPDVAKAIIKDIKNLSAKLADYSTNINIMEVCGSHTMAIGRYGIRDVLPKNVNLISGPGCPVCVTGSGYIDVAIELAEKGAIIASFGDMINVPGSGTSLSKCRSENCQIEVCYSPLNAIEIAKKNPTKEVIFLAIGFETTTAPCVALVNMIIKQDISNLSILTAFKLVPPALEALVTDTEINIDAFLCPAHVSAIIGANEYQGLVDKYKIPCVIASFEPLDILLGLQYILEQLVNKEYKVDNKYTRVVKNEGNLKAQKLINRYLELEDAIWRGIGVIPKSGMMLRADFAKYDAKKKFNLKIENKENNTQCSCGDVLKGKIKPSECKLFKKVCNPLNPIGPCMVSSEGSCAAYYKYN